MISRSSIIGLATVKRDKYSVFNFLSFSNQPEASQGETLPLTDSSEKAPDSNNRVTNTDKNETESKVDKELNKSKKMKSIFSHLVETEKETQKITKGLSFSVKSVNPKKPKEFKSIFSHLEDSDEKPKRKLIPMDTDEPQPDKKDNVSMETISQKEVPAEVQSSSSKTGQRPQVRLFSNCSTFDLFR